MKVTYLLFPVFLAPAMLFGCGRDHAQVASPLSSADRSLVPRIIEATPASETAKSEGDEIMMRDVTLAPINAGINPMAFAYLVTATVQVGSNPCMAKNAKVRLMAKVVGRELQVVAERTLVNPQGVCPMIYMPVYERRSLEVRGLRNQVSTLVLRNVDALNHDRRIDLDGGFNR